MSCSQLVASLLAASHLDLRLRGEAAAALHELDDGLSCHAAGLGGEVDALSGALGHVAGGVANEGDAALHAAGAGVFGDGVGFDLDDLACGSGVEERCDDELEFCLLVDFTFGFYF